MQLLPMRMLCTMALYVTGALAYDAFDTVQPMSTSAFQCLAKSQKYVYFIGRVSSSNGLIDTQGVQNIKNAQAAQWGTDGYLFPCTTTNCPSGASQVQAVSDYLRHQEVHIQTLWLDIEIFHWSSNITQNQAFIQDMVNQAKQLFDDVGIYTSASAWNAIVGSSYNADRDLLLWWPNYDGQQNFNNFVPFGGWTKACFHQYSRNVNSGCGVTLNQNFLADSCGGSQQRTRNQYRSAS